MARRIILEVAVDSLEDAAAAERGGADRLELCGSLESHGLTPEADLVRKVRRKSGVPVMAMVRPAAGSFVADREGVAALLWDAVQVLEAGADGIVFGVLDGAGAVDARAVASLVAVAKGRDTVFHRAFDLAPDPFNAVQILIGAGVTRILSAGQSPVCAARSLGVENPTSTSRSGPGALDGGGDSEAERRARLRSLIERAAARIEILPGGGVRAANVQGLLGATGATQVHSSSRVPGRPRVDPDELQRLRAAIDAVCA